MVLTAGCAMNRLPALEGVESSLAEQADQSPKEVLSLAEKDIMDARGELEYYAPLHLSTAEKHLKKAQTLLSQGAADRDVMMEAIYARKTIAKGREAKQTVLRQLEEVFAMKDRLALIKADVFYPDEYGDQMDHIRKLINYIEKGDQDSVEKKKKEYLGDMRTLEIEVVKKKTLSEPQDYLAKAKNIDADKVAPKTFKIAEDTMKQSTIFIESYPRDDKGVEKAGLNSLRASQHAYFMAIEINKIKNMGKDDYENLVLGFETMLHRITQAMNHEDVRYMPLYDQSMALSGSVETLQKNLASCSRENEPVPLQENIVSAPPEVVKDEIIPTNTVPETINEEVESVSKDSVPAAIDVETKEPASSNTVAETPLEEVEKVSEESVQAAPDVENEEPTPPSTVTQEPHDDLVQLDEPSKADIQEYNMDNLYMSDMERELKIKKTSP